ncbi:hypothetical protein ACM66B_002070 [Microbotryomycetes sp. NB124-2]
MSTSSSALPLPAFLAPRAASTFDLGQRAPLQFVSSPTPTPELHIVEDNEEDMSVSSTTDEDLTIEVAPSNEDSIFEEFIPTEEQAEHVLNPEVPVEDDHTKTFSIGEKRIGAAPVVPVKRVAAAAVVVKPSHSSRRVKRSLVIVRPKNSTRKTKKVKKSTTPKPSTVIEPVVSTPQQPTRPSSSVAEAGPTRVPGEKADRLSQLRFIAYEHVAHETLAAFV